MFVPTGAADEPRTAVHSSRKESHSVADMRRSATDQNMYHNKTAGPPPAGSAVRSHAVDAAVPVIDDRVEVDGRLLDRLPGVLRLDDPSVADVDRHVVAVVVED